ncbi:MAG: hypothetical protein ACLFUU_11770 [Desulfobacteraceae bacterium]
MPELSKELKDKIIKALSQRQANLPCPRCGNKSFIILDGFFNPTLETELNGPVGEGASVPAVGIICKQCGHISLHSLGILGLLASDASAYPGKTAPG